MSDDVGNVYQFCPNFLGTIHIRLAKTQKSCPAGKTCRKFLDLLFALEYTNACLRRGAALRRFPAQKTPWGGIDVKLLEEKILSCGRVLPGNVLKVDNFLNHQIDVALIDELGKEFYRLFSSYPINKILTVETSGIAIACAAARCFNVPVVFAKKGSHSNVGGDVYSAEVFSFTKGVSCTITVSKKYLSSADSILIIDDFLANGEACNGLIRMIEEAGAKLAGIGIAIEKGFQPGGKALRDRGIPVKSLAIVDSMTDDSIRFRDDD